MGSIGSVGVASYALEMRAAATLDSPGRNADSFSLPNVLCPRPADGKYTDDQQKQILHLMSHVEADCFISLLQILDPLPHDERDRAEYRRHYRQLRQVLETPPPEQTPIGAVGDPLR
jgi:hypothetical protein